MRTRPTIGRISPDSRSGIGGPVRRDGFTATHPASADPVRSSPRSGRSAVTGQRGRSSVAEPQSSKLITRVRFPSPARRAPRRSAAAAAVTLVLALVALLTAPAPSVAGTVAQPTLVNTVPAANTPDVDDGIVYALAKVGHWIVVGGSFTQVTPHGGTTQARSGVFAFDARTGAVAAAFAPSVAGTVRALAPGPTAGTVFVGGKFDTVDGVADKGLALLNISDGTRVAGFTPPAMDGQVYGMASAGGRLWVVGSFTTLAGTTRDGLATLNPQTGAVQPYVTVALTGHHNYNGSGAEGAVGGRAVAVDAAVGRAVVVGNFKDADGALHDQIVVLDLGANSAQVDPNWNTAAFTAACAATHFDSYVRDVDISPDGTWFAVADTGAGGITYNTDGTRSLCDGAARFPLTTTGADVKPTWVDWTGNDSLWSVSVTGTAVYVGGHQRWENNPQGVDDARAGAVPRPGIAALSPSSGLPMAWNPGRNPRGQGAYALLATRAGLYVGSDTEWIGNRTYLRKRLAFFPLQGGETPPAGGTASLPARLVQAGPATGNPDHVTYQDRLVARRVSRTGVGSATHMGVDGIGWRKVRGVFAVGGTLWFATTDGRLHRVAVRASGALGAVNAVDPYDDPAWSHVQTGSGQTYRGVPSTYRADIPTVTGAFYWHSRLYYSMAGRSALYWRWFEPDDGVVGAVRHHVAGARLQNALGLARAGPRST